jgi:putative hydrolase of the HAD superfamily
MIKAVLFDLFGTLVDNATNAQVDDLLTRMASELGVPIEEFTAGWKATFQERSRGVHGSMEASIAAAAANSRIDFSREALVRACEVRTEFTRRWLTPRSDTLMTLAVLRDCGMKIGLLSNCSEEVPEMWNTLDLASVIDVPLFSCREGLRKPMPEFYQRAMERLVVEASECLYVADGDNGELAAAKKIGMPVVMIRPSDLLDDYRQDPEEDWDGRRIERLSELLSLNF